MFRTYVVVPAFLAVGLAVAGGIAIANPTVPLKPATALEKKYLHLRAEYNFTQDLATVRRIEASNPFYYLGMPLSDSEKKQFRAQQRVGTYAGVVTDIVQKEPDFAGLWLVNVGNGSIAVALTADPRAALVSSVKATVPSWVHVHYVKQKYTAAYLQGIVDRASRAMGAQGGTLFVTEAGVDVVKNVVVITVSNRSLIAAAKKEFGEAGVTYAVGQPTIGADTGPMPAPSP